MIILLVTYNEYTKAQINKNDCKPFKLTIKVNNLDTGKIRIMYGNNCNDTSAKYISTLKNGVATFTGTINRVTEAILVVDLTPNSFSLDGPKVIRFILEAKTMNLSYSVNELGAYNIHIYGSDAQKKLEIWQKTNNKNLNLINTVSENLNKNTSPDKKAVIIRQLDSIYLNITQNLKKYISNNKHSYESIYLLKKYWRKMPLDSLKFYYSQLSIPTQNNEIGNNLLDNILTVSSKNDAFMAKYGNENLNKQLKDAKGFYDFKLIDDNNQFYDLGNLKGQYTFVNFWASWCEPCIKNLPAYEKFKVKYNSQQINILTISFDKDPKSWKKSLISNKISGVNLIDADGVLKSFYNIIGVPLYMIIKPDGSVADINVSKPGSFELNKIIDKYILVVSTDKN